MSHAPTLWQSNWPVYTQSILEDLGITRVLGDLVQSYLAFHDTTFLLGHGKISGHVTELVKQYPCSDPDDGSSWSDSDDEPYVYWVPKYLFEEECCIYVVDGKDALECDVRQRKQIYILSKFFNGRYCSSLARDSLFYIKYGECSEEFWVIATNNLTVTEFSSHFDGRGAVDGCSCHSADCE
jgi:hypothetical protein